MSQINVALENNVFCDVFVSLLTYFVEGGIWVSWESRGKFKFRHMETKQSKNSSFSGMWTFQLRT